MDTITHQANKAAARRGGRRAAVAETLAADRPAQIVATAPAPSTPNFDAWPPALRPMRATVERFYDFDPARAIALHSALAILRGMPSFAAGEGASDGRA